MLPFHVMPAPPDEPPPRKLALKPSEFERVNEIPGASATPGAANDPLELLRLNREHEKSIGLHENLPTAPRGSRRLRDYFASLIAGNACAALIVWLLPGAAIFALSGALIFSGGLSWVMLFNMDDYE